jgi:hypothetical protein
MRYALDSKIKWIRLGIYGDSVRTAHLFWTWTSNILVVCSVRAVKDSKLYRDVRKTKLTLKQLNRLRIMNDIRKLEQEKKIEDVKAQFTPPPEPNMGM